MKRFVVFTLFLILVVFIGAGIINSDADPPCAELTEISNETPSEILTSELAFVYGEVSINIYSQNFPNTFNYTDENVSENMTSDCTIGTNGIASTPVLFSNQNGESVIMDIASQTGTLDKPANDGQYPKALVIGNIDTFIDETLYNAKRAKETALVQRT